MLFFAKLLTSLNLGVVRKAMQEKLFPEKFEIFPFNLKYTLCFTLHKSAYYVYYIFFPSSLTIFRVGVCAGSALYRIMSPMLIFIRKSQKYDDFLLGAYQTCTS